MHSLRAYNAAQCSELRSPLFRVQVVEEKCLAYGAPKVRVLVMDVLDTDSHAKLAAQVFSEFKKIDVLVICSSRLVQCNKGHIARARRCNALTIPSAGRARGQCDTSTPTLRI